ncbi:MAG: aminoglycoside phosphotransferase family protein, partial [Aggregatilineales bacterium]
IEATRIIGEVLNKLHVVRENTVPGSITSLRRRFRALQQQASNDKLAGRDTIYRRGATQADMLLATAREQCLLHGDMHHENVRHHPERGWLAFDPKGLFGERTFDAANTLCNPVGMPDLVKDEARLLKNADILAETMEMDRDRLLQFTFAYACLSAVWSAEDEQSSDLALAVAHMLEKHL